MPEKKDDVIKKESANQADADYRKIIDDTRAATAKIEAELAGLSAPHNSRQQGGSIPPPPVDSGPQSDDDKNMDIRITKLESLAEKSIERLTSLDRDVAIIRSNYATKADLASMETTILKWFVATAITLSSLAFVAAKFIN